MRDSQRSKVYAADSVLDGYSKRYPTVAEIEAFIAQVWERPRLRIKYGHQLGIEPPQVKDGRGRRNAFGSYWRVGLPVWARTSGVILHELAHVIKDRTRLLAHEPRSASHGWRFCAIYLDLVAEMMGMNAYTALLKAMKANRVRYKAPRKKRMITPERKEALIIQLQAARAKRLAAKAPPPHS